MSDEQEIASQEPTAVEEETPVITSEKQKEDTQEDTTLPKQEETQDVDLLGLDNEDVQQDEAIDESKDIIQEDAQQETENSPADEIEETVIDEPEVSKGKDTEEATPEEPQSEESVVEDTDAIKESNAKEIENVDSEPATEESVDDATPTEDDAIAEAVVESEAVIEEVAVEEKESPSPANEEPLAQEEETPMEDVAIEEVEPQSANEETEVEEESPVKDVPIEEAVDEASMEDVPIEEEEQPSPEIEETVVEEEHSPMEDVPIEETEAAVEEVVEETSMEVEDEVSEPIPEAGDECAQEPVEEEAIPTVESKDLEEALEETEQDAKLNAEAEELAQAVDRNINIDPAVVVSTGVATAAVGAVAVSFITKEVKDGEAPAAQDRNLIRPIVIAGPSGAGKGTLIEGLMKRFPNDQFGFSVSHTTRKPREGEVNGVHYNFTSVESIKEEIDVGKFIEYAEVHGNYYGTSVDAVKSVQEEGKVCILDIDVQGVRNVKKSSLKPYYIFIAPPSMEDLEARLRGRGTEKEEDVQKRLTNAAGEIQFGKEPGNFDKYLVNGNLAFAANDLATSVKEWYPHLKEVAVDPKESNFVQDCITTATETCIIS